jgi:hypothetical protein
MFVQWFLVSFSSTKKIIFGLRGSVTILIFPTSNPGYQVSVPVSAEIKASKISTPKSYKETKLPSLALKGFCLTAFTVGLHLFTRLFSYTLLFFVQICARIEVSLDRLDESKENQVQTKGNFKQDW